MKKINIIALVLGLTSFAALAVNTSTECTFKKNPKNKIFITFDYHGKNETPASVMLFIETQEGLRDFTYFNYAFMVQAINYREQTPWGKRAELLNIVDQIDQTGKFSFDVVNYNTTLPSMSFAALPKSKKELGLVRGKISLGFEAKVRTIINTNMTKTLENGTTMSENDVSCVLKYL